MRPTGGSMLQQNNNNNYPCLGTAHSAQEILQKCSRTSLLLGDLPLVRGLRAWVLCSKNSSRAGGLPGGGKAPTAPPLGRRSSTSCPRPADVYLSGALGGMGYGLPPGLDARALVTVATLKPSEGSGKTQTQTQCLFLRTERGSCLYTTAKPSPGGIPGSASGVVGEWLKGKTGGGAESSPALDGVRVRSGRRWRKSGSVATGQEKRERQEERDKGGPDGEGSSCCVSPKTCGRLQRRRSQDEDEAPGKLNEVSGHRQDPNPDPESDPASSSRDAEEEMNEEPQIHFTGTQEDHMETRQDQKPELSFHQDDEEPETQTESIRDPDSLRPHESSAPVGGRVCSPDPELDLSCGPEPVTRDSSKTRNDSVSWKEEDGSSQLEEEEKRTVEGGDGTTSIRLDDVEAETPEEEEEEEEEEGHRRNTDQDVSVAPRVKSNTCVFNPGAPFSPAPSLPPLASMATGLPSLEAEEEEDEAERGDERRRRGEELEERGSAVAPEEEEEEEEEDEFGVFMQAEGEPAWSEGVNGSASVPCGSRGGVEPGNHTSSDWTGGPLHQSDDTWAAFPQEPSGSGGDAVEQWWPHSAVEAAGNQLWTNQSPASVFAEAFPLPPAASPGDPCDLDAVPTLAQLLGGRAGQDQRLLNHFHDLNKMIGRSYKRASRTSRDLLLKAFHLQQPLVESRPASWTTNRHLSPGLPSANQNAHNAAAKRRLSYDYNRNVVE